MDFLCLVGPSAKRKITLYKKANLCYDEYKGGDHPHEQEARVMNERGLMPCACYQVTGGG